MIFDSRPRGKQGDRRQKRSQQDEQNAQAINTEMILDVPAAD